jgi:hypothetical protein
MNVTQVWQSSSNAAPIRAGSRFVGSACQGCAMTVDERAVEVMLGLQRQVLSREQALASGVTPSGIQHRTRRGGPWQRLLPGVYLTTSGEPAREQLTVAAMLYAGPASLLTGPAALRT